MEAAIYRKSAADATAHARALPAPRRTGAVTAAACWAEGAACRERQERWARRRERPERRTAAAFLDAGGRAERCPVRPALAPAGPTGARVPPPGPRGALAPPPRREREGAAASRTPRGA